MELLRVLSPLAPLLISAAALAAPVAVAAAPKSEWNFSVLLDGKPIGHHRFALVERGSDRDLISDARFSVTVLKIPFYRYTHHATESWRGDCLQRIDATTNDDGHPQFVRGARTGSAFVDLRAVPG